MTTKAKPRAGNWRNNRSDTAPDEAGTGPKPSVNGHAPSANGVHKKPENQAADLAAKTWAPTGEAIKRLVGSDDKRKILAMDRKDFEEVYATMDTLIASHHQHIVDSEADIALIWLLKPSYSSGKLIVGKTKIASDEANALIGLTSKKSSGYQFVIYLDASAWEKFVPDQREALMDHLLCHAVAELEEQSERGNAGWKFKLRKHDIEEFTEVVQRHGLYVKDLQDFVEIAKDAAKPNLFTDVNAEEPASEEASA